MLMTITTTTMASKYIFDIVHRSIPISPFVLSFIDTPEFQRLRRIKQLGCASFVYPTATHTRFEHSIGVGHLACRLMTWLSESQPELNIQQRCIDLVTCAGTMHDIGHGPFSHLYDEITQTNHEERSCAMVLSMCEKYALCTKEEAHLICAMIIGNGKGYLYQIVNNKLNGFDVDKWDYIARDATMVGFTSSIDFDRLIRNCRVVQGQLCYHRKIYDDIFEVYRQRHYLHRKIYNHNVCICIEEMVKDIIDVSGEFLDIDDSILYRNPHHPILKRLERRELYTVVGHRITHDAPKIQLPPILGGTWSIRSLALWKDTNHPMDNMYFFTNRAGSRWGKIKRSEVSKLYSPKYKEVWIRLLSKEKENHSKLAVLFETTTNKINGYN